jgi:hypothetical protein
MKDKLYFTFKFGKQSIFSKFRICADKFQIEAGHHRKIQREGRVVEFLD